MRFVALGPGRLWNTASPLSWMWVPEGETGREYPLMVGLYARHGWVMSDDPEKRSIYGPPSWEATGNWYRPRLGGRFNAIAYGRSNLNWRGDSSRFWGLEDTVNGL